MAEEVSPAVLRSGSSGREVKNLQNLLSSLGHDPGQIDGEFGEATEKAVRAYQRSNDMVPDGIVAAQTSLAIYSASSGPDTKGVNVSNLAESEDTQIAEPDVLQANPDVTADHLLTSLRFSVTALLMMRVATDLAQGRQSKVYSETLYFGVMCIAVRGFGTSPDPVIKFLNATRPGNGESGQSFEQMLEDYAKAPISSLGRNAEPFEAHDQHPELSENTAAILLRAGELATRSFSSEIKSRHLVGGMLLSSPVKQEPVARKYLTSGGQDLDTLKRQFFIAISASRPNERDFWESELGLGIDRTDALSPDTPKTDDPLLERLLGRNLAVSTLGSKDVDSAIELINGPKSWGLGPKINQRDLLLIYFPKTLTGNSGLREFGVQRSGLRFLLRAGSQSEVADVKTYRHRVTIDKSVELREPVDTASFVEPPLNDWSMPKQQFRRAGRELKPLTPDLARALWTEILEHNSDQRSEIEALLGVSPPPTEFVMRNLLTRDTWTTEDELGYGLYAQAITDSIFEGSSVPPLTVGIQAPWGQGKTSLMRMIQKRFDPEAPERDLRKLETNGETAVAATFGHLHDWLKTAAKWNRDARKRTPSPAADRHDTAPPAQAPGDRASADTGTQADSSKKVPFWQDQDIDKLPDEKGEPEQIRRPGLLINEQRRVPTVWFNPLYYGTTEQVWAGLAHAMLQQLSSQIDDPIKREEFWFRLQLRRINVDAVAHDLRKAFWLRIAPTAAKYVAVGLAALATAILSKTLALFGVAGTAVVGLLHGWSLNQTAMKSWSLETQFEKYVSEPDYRSHLGMLHWVDHDLDRALDLLCGDYPVAVFIDDLDRCDPKIVAEIIFAINQFLSLPRRNVFFFIGMDTEMVAAALEEARDMPRAAGAAHTETHQSFGWRFMEKFIQLPFVIPHLNDKTAKDFAANRLGGSLPNGERDAESTENGTGEAPIPPEETEEVIQKADKIEDFEELSRLAKEEGRRSRSQDERAQVQQAFSKRATELLSDPESEEINRIVEVAIEDLELNPRSITRYFGAVRILRNLQLSTGALSAPDRDRVIVLRAAHLLLNWPEAVQWLQRTKEILTPEGEWVSTVPGLEFLIAESADWTEWSKLWLGEQPTALPPVFRDHKLHAFLKKTVANPPGLREIHEARFF